MPESPRVLYSLFCERVSEEDGRVTAHRLLGGRITAPGPFSFDALVLVVYVHNPARQGAAFALRLQVPGQEPHEIGSELPIEPDIFGHSLNFELNGLSIAQPGLIEASFSIGGAEAPLATATLDVVFATN